MFFKFQKVNTEKSIQLGNFYEKNKIQQIWLCNCKWLGKIQVQVLKNIQPVENIRQIKIVEPTKKHSTHEKYSTSEKHSTYEKYSTHEQHSTY